MSILKRNFKISVWDDVWDSSKGKFVEKRIGVIGSHDMTSPCRALEPNLTRNVNGTKKFSFKMYKYCRDEITGEKILNPFSEWLVNERKVKLERDGQTYDFLIKNIQETSANYLYTYTLEDANITELSKNGYSVVLDTKAENNLGTLKDLAEKVLLDTDWEVESEKFVEKIEEGLVYLKVNTAFSAKRVEDQDTNFGEGVSIHSTVSIPKDSYILGFYSSCVNKPYRFQFLYFPGITNPWYQETEKIIPIARTEKRIIDVENCQYYFDISAEDGYNTVTDAGYTHFALPKQVALFNPSSLSDANTKDRYDTLVSSWYRGERYGYVQKQVYSAKLDKYLSVYGASGNIYGYNETKYHSPILINNTITSPGMDSTSGWKCAEFTKEVEKIIIEPVQGRFSTTTNQFVSSQDELKSGTFSTNNKYQHYLKLTFPKSTDKTKVRVFNTGIYDNRTTIENFEKGDVWAFRCEYRIGDRDYSYPGSGPLAFDLEEYQYQTVQGVYQKEETQNITFTRTNRMGTNNVAYETFTVDSSGYNKETFKKDCKIYISFGTNSSQGTDTVVYLKDMQLFKTQLTEDEKVLPSMADMDTVEGTTTTTYKYFTSAALDAATSEEDLNILVKSDKPLNRDYPPYFVEGAQKVRTVNAKESNYFNILQSIAETFQAWLSLEVIRDEGGAISRKIAKFKNYVGKKNYAGFRYGVNLKDIQRTFESNNLVTKLIVKPNKNKYGEGGFCTIQRAGSNETGENFIYDLQYYYNIGLLDPKVNNELLYTGVGQSGADISGDENSTWNVNNYFSRLKRINTLLKPINEELSNTSLELVKLKAKKEVADAAVKAAASGIQDVRSNFSDYTAGMDIDSISFQSPLKNIQLNTTKVDMNETLENSSKKIAWSDEKISSITISQTASNTNNWTYKFTVTLTEGVEKETTLYFKAHPYVTYTNNTTETLKYTIPCVVPEGSSSCTAELIVAPIDFNSSKIQQLLAQYAEYLTTDDEQSAALTKLNADIADVEEKIETLTEASTRYLDWKAKLNLEFYKKYSRFISEGTWVDEKYSDDEKYYNDALSVLYNSCYPRTAYTINVAAVEGVEGYEDYTFDIGDQTYVFDPQFFGENAREPVIVAEITEAIDNPSAVQIKVQNFKNQFQDLFQKITATVQSVQYSTGAYEKAAALAEAGQPQKYAFLSDALDDAEAALQVAGQQTVITDGSGITVHKEGNNREALRLVSGAILFSTEENGEQKWKTGITPKGISADLVTAGQIDTGAIRIMNGKDETFKWDTNGITAYDYEDNTLNKEKFVRLDRHGLYGVDGTVNGDIYAPGNISQVDADATFALTWEGLKVTGDNGGTARIGKQRKNSKNYIMVVKDAEGKDTLRIDEAGHLELRKSLTIGDMGDDEKTFSEYVSGAADAAETNAKNYADTQIDNIEIGGRNLAASNLINHTATVNNSFLNGVNLTADTEYGGTIFGESLLKAGQVYTLSFRFQKTAGTLINFGGHNTGHTVTRATLDGEIIPNYVNVVTIKDDSLEHYVTITFKTESDNKPFYIQLNRARETSITYNLWDIKIEKGSKATDWTPAPEDIAADITATNSLIEGVRDNLQSQIDGEITSWFYAEDPTTTNPPANGWTTENEKIRHEGDLYYNTESGAAYRWVYFDDKKEHGWTRITDEAIAEALNAANTAQSTADGKMTVFVSTTGKPQPTPPYQIGDLWVNATYSITGTPTYSNDLLRCKTQKARGASFDIEDWELASKYTDNTELENFIDNTYEVFAEQIQEQVDAKAEIYYQGTDPADYEGDDKWGANQVGDLWRCTAATSSKTSTLTDALVSRAANSEWIWKKNKNNSYGWHEMEVPNAVFDAYDGKSTMYVTKPSSYKRKDVWVLDKEGLDTSSPNYDETYPPYKLHSWVICVKNTAEKITTYSKSDWEEITRYTDDTAINNMQIGGKNLFVYANKGIVSNGDDWQPYNATLTETDQKYRWNVSASSGNGGFKFNSALFEAGKEYICSYHYKKTSGELTTIGGHSEAYTTKSFILDGVNKGALSKVDLTDETSPIDHFVEWHFVKKEESTASDKNLYIQLNRGSGTPAVAADIWDLQIEQGTKRTSWRLAEEDLESEIDTISGQLDKKAETWYTNSDPSSSWDTPEDKAKHVGDLWYYNGNTDLSYTENSTTKYRKPHSTWVWTEKGTSTKTYQWEEMAVSKEVFDKIDGKSSIYVSKPNSYEQNDIWILDAATQEKDSCPTYKDSSNADVKYAVGTVLVSTTSTNTYDKTHWVEKVKYIDSNKATSIANDRADAAIKALNLPASTSILTTGMQISSSVNNGITTITVKDKNNGSFVSSTTVGENYIATDVGLGSGSIGPNGDKKFLVDASGTLMADNAIIHGTIFANEGYMGGWHIAQTVTGTTTKVYSGSLTYGDLGTDKSFHMYANDFGVIGKIDKKNISGTLSDTNAGWKLTVGSKFGVDANGNLYASGGNIAGWDITSNSITKNTFGTLGSFHMYSSAKSDGANGEDKPYLFGSDSSKNWLLGVGSNFGVTEDGSLYCSNGKFSGSIEANAGSMQNLQITGDLRGNKFTINSEGINFDEVGVLQVRHIKGSATDDKITIGETQASTVRLYTSNNKTNSYEISAKLVSDKVISTQVNTEYTLHYIWKKDSNYPNDADSKDRITSIKFTIEKGRSESNVKTISSRVFDNTIGFNWTGQAWVGLDKDNVWNSHIDGTAAENVIVVDVQSGPPNQSYVTTSLVVAKTEGASFIEFQGDLQPSAGNSYTLGSLANGRLWNSIQTKQIYFDDIRVGLSDKTTHIGDRSDWHDNGASDKGASWKGKTGWIRYINSATKDNFISDWAYGYECLLFVNGVCVGAYTKTDAVDFEPEKSSFNYGITNWFGE